MQNLAATPTSNTSEKIVVERDNGRNLLFTGELITKVSSSDNRAMGSSWSGPIKHNASAMATAPNDSLFLLKLAALRSNMDFLVNHNQQ